MFVHEVLKSDNGYIAIDRLLANGRDYFISQLTVHVNLLCGARDFQGSFMSVFKLRSRVP